MKQIIIISKEVTKVIEERLPKIEVNVFTSIEALESYVAKTPIRADVTYVTTSCIEPLIHSNLSKIIQLADTNYFFKTEEVVVLTTSKEINKAIEFIQQEETTKTVFKIKNVKETKSEITGYITGDNVEDSFEVSKKSVYRIRKEEYIEVEKRRNRLQNKFREKNALRSRKEIELQEMDAVIVPGTIDTKEVYIAGTKGIHKEIFALIYSQYISISGKTVLLESDFKYKTISYLADRCETKHTEIPIEELIAKPKEVMRDIQDCEDNLIVLTSNSNKKYEPIFLSNLLYANISDRIKHIVLCVDMEEIPENVDYFVCMENNMISLLEAIKDLPRGYSQRAKFIVSCRNYPKEIAINNSIVMGDILKDILSLQEAPYLKMIETPSLILKGSVMDLGGL